MSDKYDVFISYRRLGGAAEARLIQDKLLQRNLRVFLDVDELRPGHFDKSLLSCIEATPNFIVILSPGCLQRCADEGDWMRQEIAQAMRTGRTIIPVMLHGFAFPEPETLPPDIRALPTYHGVSYSHDFFAATVAKIVQYLDAEAAPMPPAPAAAPGLGPLVYKLCDRTSQENAFTNLFKTNLRQQPARPQTYFIHGAHGECHDSLVERLRDTRISLIAEKRWGAQRGVVTYKQPGWPHEGELTEQQQDLRINLFKEFDPAYEGDDLSAAALRRLEPLRLSPLVVVHHKIYARHWTARTRRLVDWYLSYWDEIKAGTDGPQFLVFLSVIYPAEGGAARARPRWKFWGAAREFDKAGLRAELDEIVRRNAEAGRLCFALKELTPPKQFEVQEWFSYYRIYDEQTQREKLAALFPEHVEQLSMSQLEHALKKIHAEFVSEKGYF